MVYDLRGPLAGVFGEKTVGCRRKKTSEKATAVVDAREDGAILLPLAQCYFFHFS